MRMLAVCFAHFILGSIALAQPATPPGPPPTFRVVYATHPEKGHAVTVETVVVYEQVLVTEKVNVNGMIVDVTKTKMVPVMKQMHVSHNIAASRIITPEGKQLPIDEVWKRMKKDTVVIFSSDHNPPAASYLRALHADTLVVIPAPPKMEPVPK